MKKLLFGAVCLSVLVSAAGLFLTGCDEAEGLELIVITPTEKEMTTRETTVWLTASFPGATKQTADDTNTTSTTVGLGDPVDADDILHLPLEWSVANGSLGQIIGSGGTSALYVRTPNTGVNRVTVRDQYDNVGYADIRQMVEQYRLELTAVSGSASNNLNAAYIPAGAVTATLRVSSAIGGDGPTAPFTWSVVFPTRGYILAGQGSDTAVYRTTSEGETGFNVVQCTDAYGVTGTILVQLGEEDDGGGGGGTSTTDTSVSVTADDGPDIDNGDRTKIVRVQGGTPPYVWSIEDLPAGVGPDYSIATPNPADTSYAELTTDGKGSYEIQAIDSLTRKGQILIEQN